ncbi:MAG: GNAT family N-acetyltransferase [Pseudomonadota bacterium]
MVFTGLPVTTQRTRFIPDLKDRVSARGPGEDYALGVTEQDVRERGLGERPLFQALVAHEAGSNDLLGMAVVFEIPYTYHGKPDLFLKELFVTDAALGKGIGHHLFDGVKAQAKALGCRNLRWLVANWNDDGKAFYSKNGGQREDRWQEWVCSDLG